MRQCVEVGEMLESFLRSVSFRTPIPLGEEQGLNTLNYVKHLNCGHCDSTSAVRPWGEK